MEAKKTDEKEAGKKPPPSATDRSQVPTSRHANVVVRQSQVRRVRTA